MESGDWIVAPNFTYLNEIVRIARLASFLHELHALVLWQIYLVSDKTLSNILIDRALKQDRFLLYKSNVASQPFGVVFANIASIDQDVSGVR